MKKSIIIIGAGMGGLATGIYGQRSGFETTIFEAHHLPGGQCTSWNRKGYVFDGCLHFFGGSGGSQTKFDLFWHELGAFPCEMIATQEAMAVVDTDGTSFYDYYDMEKLERHLKQLSPEDAEVIDEYIYGIKQFARNNPFIALSLGSFPEKAASLPVLLARLKYFKCTLEDFAERFKHPLLRKAFPLLHYSAANIPLFLHLAKHADVENGNSALPMGGSFTLAQNMARRYEELGGNLCYRKKVIRILTENNCACGVELEDGTIQNADFIVSNADGRKTIMQMLGGRFTDERIINYCKPNEDDEVPWSILVFLGVKQDLCSYPSALIVFLDEPEVIGGHTCHHLDMQIFGHDTGMAPLGKGVIKVELFSKPSYFSKIYHDKVAYRAEKDRIAEQVISLLNKKFPGLREDIEVVDVATLNTWERFMGGTYGFNNFPNKKFNVIESLFDSNGKYSLPGLKSFFFVGQWATSAGALIINALSGKSVVKKICRVCGTKFV